MDKQQLAGNLYRNLRILAVLTVVFLTTLALAPFKWHNSEWRDAQREYNRRARGADLGPMAVALKQIWRPEIGLADRCISCHVGKGAATPLAGGGPLHGPHPEVHHDVARMGCTICHRGQGRATTRAAAHGEVEHWEDPMLPRPHLEAACGPCHGEAVPTPALPVAERGAYLFELHGCQACHRVDGRGGVVGPDLSGVGLKGFDRAWHIRHLRDPAALVEGSQMMSFGHLADAEIDAIVTYLDTLIGAPRLVRGKAIAVELGCRGCHKIGGLGGDLGMDLALAAAKTLAGYDFSHVDGDHTLVEWHRQHLRDPQRVAPGSTMPAFRLPADDEQALITYILSLRPPAVPMDELPRQTVLTQLAERRDFAADGLSRPGLSRPGLSRPGLSRPGATLYGAFCAACHGPDGRGQALAALGTTVPDLRNPETLNIASRESMRHTIVHGRPGRFMPAWGAAGGGLRDAEIDVILDYLRRDLPSPPDFAEVAAASADVDLGRRTFRQDCAACHGLDAGGTDIAPSLDAPELQFVADDRYFYDTVTRGRAGTAMPSHPAYDARTLKSLIGWIRARGRSGLSTAELAARRAKMERTVRELLDVTDLASYRAGGSPAYGEILYRTTCAGCHGPRGRGGLGPAIANPDFLRVASDGFVAGSIILGRSQRAMQAFGPHGLAALEGREVGDLIAYLRQLSAFTPPTPGYRTVQGTPEHGGELYGRLCVGCHGAKGAGGTAPALANQGFLDSVTDGFLQATLVRGRPGTAMRSWARGGYGFAELEPQEINDIVAYIRSWHTGSGGGPSS